MSVNSGRHLQISERTWNTAEIKIILAIHGECDKQKYVDAFYQHFTFCTEN